MALIVGLIFGFLAFGLTYKTMDNWSFLIAAIVTAMVTGSFIGGQKTTNESAMPKTFGSMSERIESYTGENTKNIEVTLRALDSYGGSSYIYSASEDMGKILQEARKKYGGGKYDTIHFVINGKAVDPYGKESVAEVFRVTYNMGEVDKVNFDGVAPVAIMDRFTVGNIDIGPIGKPALLDFCKNNMASAPNFCSKIFSK